MNVLFWKATFWVGKLFHIKQLRNKALVELLSLKR